MKYILLILITFNLNAKTSMEYYEMLKNNCKDKCCLYSYNIMKENKYVLHNDTNHCINIDQLKCKTTYRWCKDITYDQNIYEKNKLLYK